MMIAPTFMVIEKALADFNWINKYDPTKWAEFECFMRGDEPVIMLRIGRIHSDGSHERAIGTYYYEAGTYPFSVRTRFVASNG